MPASSPSSFKQIEIRKKESAAPTEKMPSPSFCFLFGRGIVVINDSLCRQRNWRRFGPILKINVSSGRLFAICDLRFEIVDNTTKTKKKKQRKLKNVNDLSAAKATHSINFVRSEAYFILRYRLLLPAGGPSSWKSFFDKFMLGLFFN